MKNNRIMSYLAIAFVMLISQTVTAQTPAEALRKTGIVGGIVVQLGCRSDTVTTLRQIDRIKVQGLDTNAKVIQQLRNKIFTKGHYGPVTVNTFDGKKLPYIDNFVNVLIVEKPFDVSPQEMQRVITPGGTLLVKSGSGWKTTKKQVQPDTDEWTHYLHGPNNNAVAKDKKAGMPRSLQWVGGQRWGRSHEELASISCVVTSSGRLFYIEDEAPHANISFMPDWKLIARDAYNGSLLWKKDIPQWNDHLRHFRSGPSHLKRRLVAYKDRVYITLGLAASVTALDSKTGEVVKTYKATEHTEEIIYSDGVLYLVIGSSEQNRIGGGLYMRNEPKATKFRFIAAYNTETGIRIWKKDFSTGPFLLPQTLTVSGDGTYCMTTTGIHKLHSKTGNEHWFIKRPALSKRMGFSTPTIVATDKVLLCSDQEPRNTGEAGRNQVQWGVNGWNEPGFNRFGASRLVAYSVKDGKEMWSQTSQITYNSPTDIFVIGNTVWATVATKTGDLKPYDLMTGKLINEVQVIGDKVGMGHHRCYRNKATENFIFTGRSGIEVVDVKKGIQGNNSWVRGTCQYGIMPANGMLYAPTDSCACYGRVKVQGFNAIVTKRAENATTDKTLLIKGPAFGKINGKAAGKEEWPMYRSDIKRSGSAKTEVSATPSQKWQVKPGVKLTAPIVADGILYVAGTENHTVYAFDAENGSKVWTFTADGRVDSAPSYKNGILYFGTTNGSVYCLNAVGGNVAWKFIAVKGAEQLGSFDHLESRWPIHGSVLPKDDGLYFTAGRNTYLDGGIMIFKVDLKTGAVLVSDIITTIDPKTDKQKAWEQRNDMAGTHTTLMSGDDDSVYLKTYRFDHSLKEQGQKKNHLLSITGLLGEEWFVRNYWLYGATLGGGWGHWATIANQVPAGRILSFDESGIYGYGRVKYENGRTGHRTNNYMLFHEKYYGNVIETLFQGGKRKNSKNKSARRKQVWSDTDSLTTRAMCLAGGKLFIAGPPDPGPRKADIMEFQNPQEAIDRFTGKKGVFLAAYDKAKGKSLGKIKLSCMPVFDGMITANRKLYISMQDGSIICLGN